MTRTEMIEAMVGQYRVELLALQPDELDEHYELAAPKLTAEESLLRQGMDMITELLHEYRLEVEKLQPHELQAAWDMMLQVNNLTDDQWRLLREQQS